MSTEVTQKVFLCVENYTPKASGGFYVIQALQRPLNENHNTSWFVLPSEAIGGGANLQKLRFDQTLSVSKNFSVRGMNMK